MKHLHRILSVIAICTTFEAAFGQTIVESRPTSLVTYSAELPELTKLAPELRLAVLSNGVFVGYGVSGQPLIQFDEDFSLQEIRDAVEIGAGGRISAPFRASSVETFSALPPGTQSDGSLEGVAKIDELVVTSDVALDDREELTGLQIVNRSVSGTHITVRKLGGFNAVDILGLVRAEGTLYVEPNIQLKLFSSSRPNDPRLKDGKQWGIEESGFPNAWERGFTTGQVVVAVIDTGIAYDHVDLQGNIWKNIDESMDGKDTDNNNYVDDINGYDFARQDTEPLPGPGETHGTQVVGIIGAVGNNRVGMVGGVWRTQIMPLRAFIGPYANMDDAANAIDYAVDNGAEIINVSWGTTSGQEAVRLRQALKKAENEGVLIVAAAGNFNLDVDLQLPVYPVSYSNTNIIGVAASDRGGKLWKVDERLGTNTGVNSIDLVAPGSGILSLLPADKYDDSDDLNDDGTSLAAPYVTAAAALLWTRVKIESPGLTNVQVMNKVREIILQNTSPRIAYRNKVASGGQLDLRFLTLDDIGQDVILNDSSITISGKLIMESLQIGPSGTGVLLLSEKDGPIQVDISRNHSLAAYLQNLDGEEITLQGFLYDEIQVPTGPIKVFVPQRAAVNNGNEISQ